MCLYMVGLPIWRKLKGLHFKCTVVTTPVFAQVCTTVGNFICIRGVVGGYTLRCGVGAYVAPNPAYLTYVTLPTRLLHITAVVGFTPNLVCRFSCVAVTLR